MKPWVQRVVRGLTIAAVLAFSAVTVFLAVAYICIPLLAWLSPTLNPTLYDWGFYGASPTQSFVSSDLIAPRVTAPRVSERCEEGYVFLTLSGKSVGPPGPTILDARNELVWRSEDYQVTTNLKVQRYRGEDYLTFWSGQKWGALGSGVYYLLDASYRVAHQVAAVGDGLHGDLHEFKITADNTALMSIYTTSPADLSSLGKRVNGWITDCIFQEVDIETGKLLFEWRASDHFAVSESFMTHPFGGYIKSIPFDFYHINSIDKTSDGNYLISSRHTHSISCVGPDGELLWILGGPRNQFEDLSGGAATSFRWQHDARWYSEEEGILTLFDNKEGGILHVDGPYSRGMMLKVDVANRTVSLLHDYVSLGKTRAPSQGSMQILPATNNVFIGWGHSPGFSEYSWDGELLCESHFGAMHLHGLNRAVSYRSFKTAAWVGRPDEPPAVKIEDQTLYVSWNGATEVAAWMLQGSTVTVGGNEEFIDLDILDKDGFEGSFALADLSGYSHFRVAALDRHGQHLGVSEAVECPSEGSWWTYLLAAAAWAIIIRIAWSGYKWMARRRKDGPRWIPLQKQTR